MNSATKGVEAPARPWRSTSGRRSGIVSDKGDGLGHLLDTDIPTSRRSDEEKYAIVELVVKAVNSHDALIEALTFAAETPTSSETPGVATDYDMDKIIMNARAVLAKVGT